MAKTGFLNTNLGRSFPFLAGFVDKPSAPQAGFTLANLPNEAVVDLGIMVSPRIDYYGGGRKVVLHGVKVDEYGQLVFIFDYAEVLIKFLFNSNVDRYALAFATSDDETSQPRYSDADLVGYLIVGDVASLLELLTAAGGSLSGDPVNVEPSLIHAPYLSSLLDISLANTDRTRYAVPQGCEMLHWPHVTGSPVVVDDRLTGELRLVPGYNAVVDQSAADNLLSLRAAVGAGEGEPCTEIPRWTGESPPLNGTNQLLSGSPYCMETVRAINGVGGPRISILVGPGVAITEDPVNHKIWLDASGDVRVGCPQSL